MNWKDRGEVLPRVHEALRRRYGSLTVLKGRGVPKGQRVEFMDGSERVRCAIRLTHGGRINFPRRPDGTWPGLTESDRIVIVAPEAADSEQVLIQMFDQKTILPRFEQNYAAQKAAGMSDEVPSWIAPFPESGRGARGVGGGFADQAIWSEPLVAGDPSTPVPPQTGSVRGLSIAEAKQGLAETFGVNPDAIEITIRG